MVALFLTAMHVAGWHIHNVRIPAAREQRFSQQARMCAGAGLLFAACADGTRQTLPGAGAPIAFGAVEPPPSGWFDDKTLGSFVIRRFTDEMVGDRWMMWYSARPSDFDDTVVPIATGCVGFAQSKDGISWDRLVGDERGGAVLGPNAEDWWWFDTTHVGVGDVHVMSSAVVQNSLGLYWMFYFGGDGNEVSLSESAPPTVGANMRIGLALSNDGVHWGRVEGEHSSGAVLEPQQGQTFIGWPQVVQVENTPSKWHMYYHALDEASGKFSIGLATSTNCVEWQHQPYCLTANGPAEQEGNEGGQQASAVPGFMSGGVSARCVVPNPKAGGWVMFFEAQDGARVHAIGMATSTDGVSWSVRDAPVFETASDPDAWDGKAVSRPWLVPMDDGSARLYYVGRSQDGTQAIGMACSNGDDWSSFTRHEVA